MVGRHAAFNSASTRRDSRITSATAASLWLLTIATMSCQQPAMSQELRIQHVVIVSPERPQARPNATVIVKDGRIAAILEGDNERRSRGGSSGTVIQLDGKGLFLTPGLIDSHVHLSQIPGMTEEQEKLHPGMARAARQQMPRSFLYFGFTTLLDLISAPEAMARWKNHDLVPDTFFCGGAALIDGYPMNYTPKPLRYASMPYMLVEPGAESTLPKGIDAAAHSPEAVVARMKADGAICVKTFFERGFADVHDLPVPRLETIRALVGSAHAAGLPVLLHASSVEAQTFGLDAGVDVMVHGLWNWNDPSTTTEITPAVRALLDRVVERQVGWQPTMQVLIGIRDLFSTSFLADPMLARVMPAELIAWYGSKEGHWFRDLVVSTPSTDPKALEAQMQANFALLLSRNDQATGYLAKHHANLLFGTDTPSAPTYANPPGLNAWLEMHRLVAAGVTPAQLFEAATLSNARALHLDRDIGTVEVGKRANLLLLREDPTRTIEGYARIYKVILGGRVIDPNDLAADRPH
jgi:imidazolonepropionase-like amidohydrolase